MIWFANIFPRWQLVGLNICECVVKAETIQLSWTTGVITQLSGEGTVGT